MYWKAGAGISANGVTDMNRIPIGTLCLILHGESTGVKLSGRTCTVEGYPDSKICGRDRHGNLLLNPHQVSIPTLLSYHSKGHWAVEYSELIPISPDATIRAEENELTMA